MGLHRYITLSIMEIEDDAEHEYAVDKVKELLIEMYDAGFEDVSWYDMEDEMREFSMFFPGWTFVLKIDQGGLEWFIDYYRDGKMQSCPAYIVYEEFDESKMK